ncbi:uncharacterized protein LOC124815174 [Hydra vulgaris]|uniref:uncharacterized protein LOC124815174 n=1 Tax=Hydra vulgaris TaxID=6087 RepID=UPI001F5EA204|nr:uncharacterized protein LOC124815174 [Hydra vulgaris]
MWLVKFILPMLWCQVSVLQRTEIKTEDFDCNKSIVPIPCNWRYLTYFPNLFQTSSFENVVVLIHGFKNQVVVNITLYDNINQKSYLSKFFNVQPGREFRESIEIVEEKVEKQVKEEDFYQSKELGKSIEIDKPKIEEQEKKEGYGLQCFNQTLQNNTQDAQVSIATCSGVKNLCATVILNRYGKLPLVERKCTTENIFFPCSLQCALFYSVSSNCTVSCCNTDLCNNDVSLLSTQPPTSISSVQTFNPSTTSKKPTSIPTASKILHFISKLLSKIAKFFSNY